MTLRAIIWAAVSSRAQAEDERISLPKQEADARALCEREGWQIVDVLRVPGFSRDYIDIHECARDMQAHGINAFTSLLKHWEDRDFDVLICRDAERYARTQTLSAYVVERTISVGARIYSIADGWVDEHNFRLFIALAGYKSAADNDRKRKAFKDGAKALAERGLPAGRNLHSHVVVRNEKGRAVARMVDESKRRFFDDLAELLLAGVSWQQLGIRLHERGHVSDSGKPYRSSSLNAMVMNPTFWGNTALHYRNVTTGFKIGLWIFDNHEPAPPHTTIYYGTHAPVYTGEQAELVKAELRRRQLIRGRSKSSTTHRFNRLLVCAECNYYIVKVTGSNRHPRWSCMSSSTRERPFHCSQNAIRVPQAHLQEQIDRLLREVIPLGDPNALVPHADTHNYADEIARAQADADTLKTKIRRLIHQAADAGDDLADFYREELSNVRSALTNLEAHITALQQTATAQDDYATRRQALEEIGNLDEFWAKPDVEINQLLHRLMGRYRFVVRDGAIIDTCEAPPKRRY
jgi:DNA invertase Pin-like site-specific DNA recombinase